MQTTYVQVAVRYGLTNPQQIKQRIMWNNLKAIIRQLYDHPDTRRQLDRYEADWEACEREENEGTA